MAKDKTYMPSGIAGLTRYFGEEHSVIKLTPETVIIIGFVFIGLVLMLRFMA